MGGSQTGSKGKGKKQASEVDSDLEEDEQDQLDEDEEVISGGAETDTLAVKAFQNLRHDNNIETGDEEEVGPSTGPSTTRHDGKGKEVSRWLTRLAEREHCETSQASVHVQTEQPSGEQKKILITLF